MTKTERYYFDMKEYHPERLFLKGKCDEIVDKITLADLKKRVSIQHLKHIQQFLVKIITEVGLGTVLGRSMSGTFGVIDNFKRASCVRL